MDGTDVFGRVFGRFLGADKDFFKASWMVTGFLNEAALRARFLIVVNVPRSWALNPMCIIRLLYRRCLLILKERCDEV